LQTLHFWVKQACNAGKSLFWPTASLYARAYPHTLADGQKQFHFCLKMHEKRRQQDDEKQKSQPPEKREKMTRIYTEKKNPKKRI